MQQNVSQRKVIHLPSDEEMRNMILFQKECLLHESPDPDEFNVGSKFIILSDGERRGIIKALRWIVEDDEDLLQR
jgi:hypothetical protein